MPPFQYGRRWEASSGQRKAGPPAWPNFVNKTWVSGLKLPGNKNPGRICHVKSSFSAKMSHISSLPLHSSFVLAICPVEGENMHFFEADVWGNHAQKSTLPPWMTAKLTEVRHLGEGMASWVSKTTSFELKAEISAKIFLWKVIMAAGPASQARFLLVIGYF